jgi:hypothetical protein
VVSLFTGPSVRSRCVQLEELGLFVANRSAAVVLRDATRELVAHRYRPPAGRETALAASTELDRALWAGYRPSHISRRYVLFVPTDERRASLPLALANAEVLPADATVRRDDAGVIVRPDETTYVLSGANDSFDPEIALCAGCRYTVRVDVDLGGAVTGDLVVRQLAGVKRTGESRQPLRTGENYMTWQGLTGADRYRVGVRLRSTATEDDSHAVLRRVEVKPFGSSDATRNPGWF